MLICDDDDDDNNKRDAKSPLRRRIVHTGEICLPSCLLVPCGLLLDSLVSFRCTALSQQRAIDASTDDDDIATTLSDDFVGRAVLLPFPVAFYVESDAGCKDEKVARRERGIRMLLVDSVHGNEAACEAAGILASLIDAATTVVTASEVALAAHLGKKKQAASERLADLCEACDDPRSRYEVGIGDVRPRGNFVDAGRILERNRVALRFRGVG